jgi:glycosyltransferase involved in cell wall biosynthesis
MKICMILHDPQEFGGLEEYAVTLAISLKQRGQDVSVLSTTWVPRTNQYVSRLLENGVPYIQIPKWLSQPVSHWPTKERILKVVLWLLSPLTLLLTLGLIILRRNDWNQSWKSVNGWLGKKIFRLIAPNGYKRLFLLLLGWWRMRWHPEVLHVQGYTTNLLFVVEWSYKKKIPIVYEEHQTPDAQFDWWQGFHHSINKATTVVAVSEKSAEALREVCGVTRPIAVRNPLLPDPLAPGWNTNNIHRDHDRVLQVTTVARLVEAKGLGYLLETIAKISLTHSNIDFKVYGDGPLRQELLYRAASLGLDGDAIFVGAFNGREDLSVIMAETDIFVMSSVLEGQPLSVVEAMAYGCPIVSTSVGGIPELIHDGINGLLCPPRDPMCLAGKIKILIDDPALRRSLGREARQSYEKGPFQPASVSKHFVTIYQDALLGGGPD